MKQGRLVAQGGFTLVEIMVTVVVVAILAAIGLPNYTEHLRRAQRLEARANLLEARHWMEQQFTVNNRYDGVKLPATFSQSPRTGKKRYDVTLATDPAVTSTTYTLLATPVSSMPDKCGTFMLDQSGQRGLSGQSAEMDITQCWSR